MRKLLLPALAALACLSCSPPPFNLALSLSARTARALTLEGTVGPLGMQRGGMDPGITVFIPEKAGPSGLDLQNGFVSIAPPGGNPQIFFAWWDTIKAVSQVMAFQGPLGPLPPDSLPEIFALPLKGATHTAGAFMFSSAGPLQNAFVAARADPATWQFPVPSPITQSPDSLAMTITGMTGHVLGVSLYPDTDQTLDTTYWLFKGMSADQFMEMKSFTTAGGLANPAPLPTRSSFVYPLGALIPTAATLTRALYYYDPEPARAPQRSFVSLWDAAGSRWRCWTWWTDATLIIQGNELTGVSHRIDALLTTGELFSTEGDVGYLYSRDGTQLSQFTLTGLKLVGEYYVNGTARVIFSQLLFYDGKPWFNVYSIPTADMATLAQ